MFKLEWLQAFVRFADEPNLSRTARQLHLSEPALHLQLARLAEELGCPLYHKRGRKLELTVQGEQVACFGRELEERIQGFLQELHEGREQQPVVLAAGEGAYLYLLGEAIRCYRELRVAPLTLQTRDRDASLEALRSGRAHLAVTSLDEVPPDLEGELLVEVPAVLALPADHPLAARDALRLTELTGARLIVPPVDRPARQELTRALAHAAVRWEVAVEASGWPLMLHFVELGLGLAVVNGCCRLPRGLVARPLPELPPTRYYVLARPDPPPRAAVRQLRATLVAGTWRRNEERGARSEAEELPTTSGRPPKKETEPGSE